MFNDCTTMIGQGSFPPMVLPAISSAQQVDRERKMYRSFGQCALAIPSVSIDSMGDVPIKHLWKLAGFV